MPLRIFFNDNVWIWIEISLTFVPKGPIYNIPALVQIMAWRHPGDKPLFEPMMDSLPTHICVIRPQWVNTLTPGRCGSIIIKSVISDRMLQNKLISTCEIAPRWMPQNTFNTKSILVQLMAWCHQATSHISWANIEPHLSCHTRLPEPMLTQIYVAVWCH